MFVINEDKSIYITRGDVAFFSIKATTDTGEAYKFQAGDVVRFKVFEKKACENVVLSKDFGIEAETEEVEIYLEEKDTKIGDVISKPVEYWYEVELNPYTDPQTILGYDEDGAKVFRLYPEGNEAEDYDPVTPEDIPVVDEELSLTSTRPVQNQAIARAIVSVRSDLEKQMGTKFFGQTVYVEEFSGSLDADSDHEFVIPLPDTLKHIYGFGGCVVFPSEITGKSDFVVPIPTCVGDYMVYPRFDPEGQLRLCANEQCEFHIWVKYTKNPNQTEE